MRILYLLRGAPASGKSTWIKENHLEPYTISSDNIRLMIQSPVYNVDGNKIITQNNDSKVWSVLMNCLENRMSRGEFCIVDATHYKIELMRKYKDLVTKYRYRVYVIDFTNIDLETLLKRNMMREQFKIVPEEVIKKMYSVFKNENNVKQIPGYIKILSKDEAIKKINEEPLFDFNQYEKITVIPDIHGCYEPIEKYFSDNPINEKYFYIFLGDYIDRGKQNKEVLEFLFSIMNNKNVLLLEGNHEKWLRRYCNEESSIEPLPGKDVQILSKYINKIELNEIQKEHRVSKEFKNNTIPQIKSIDKSLIRKFCDRLGQFAYFKYGDKVYCMTHGGLSNKPSILMSTNEMINGIGKYQDTDKIYNAWNNNTPSNYIQMHGHRNIYNLPSKFDDKNYNLNSGVEYGEDLRIAEITKDSIKIINIPNNTYIERLVNNEMLYIKTKDELYKSLNESKIINKKTLNDNIVSYNFSRNAFNKSIWNDVSVKARGLFINSETQNVTARSYNKFFNIEEQPETYINNLKNNISFPLIGYRKENGFLGLVSWDHDNEKLFISSKSTNEGNFAQIVKEQFNKLEHKDLIIEYLQNNNCTLVFEVIDIEKDPHIIEYGESCLYLLDCIENQLNECKKLEYEELTSLGVKWNIRCKIKDYVFNNWEEFYKFYNDMNNNYILEIEGWVFEDQKGFMFKYKTPFYKYWKYMRSIKESIYKGRNIRQIFNNENDVRIINYMKSLDIEKLNKMSIIDIRNNFLLK